MKKTILRKLLSVSLVTAMTAAMLGCGGNSSSSSGASAGAADTAASGSSDTAAPAQEASGTEKVPISIYRASFNIATPDSSEVEAIQNAINDYIADKINVEIHLTDLGEGEYPDKTNLALSNGEVNLLWTASWIGSLSPDNLYAQNAVYDITDLLPGSKLYGSMPEAIWDASAYNGRDYFISCYKESAEGYDLVTQKSFVDKFGWDLSSVKEMKDIEPMLADCKAEGIKYPLLTQMMSFFFRYYIDDYDFFLKNSMIAIDRETDTVVSTVLSDDYVDFCTMMCDWGEKGYISEEEATKTSPTASLTQDWGFIAWCDVPDNGAADTTYGMECEIIPITEKWSHSTSTLGSCFAISSACTEEQAQACVDFLGLMYTDSQLADLFTYGIEGVDYDKVDGYVVKKGDMYNHSAWESGSVSVISLEEGEPENKVQMYEDFNNNSKSSSASGFRFDSKPIEAQWAACQSVFDQYGYVLESGGYKAADVPKILEEYQAALDEAGFQDVLAEAQTQYEAWKAEK